MKLNGKLIGERMKEIEMSPTELAYHVGIGERQIRRIVANVAGTGRANADKIRTKLKLKREEMRRPENE